MGVVYKLKDDVIHFILEHKKNNPQVSCRELSRLATENFQQDISKSSVNNILKNQHLSSSVGRRAIAKKKFTIPDDKKKQIQANLQKIIISPSESKPSAPKAQIAAPEPFAIPPKKTYPIQKIEAPQAESPSEKKLFLAKMDYVRAKRIQNRLLYKNMGLIFIKAAMEELGVISLVNALIKKKSWSPLPEHLEGLCEAVLLNQVLEKFEETPTPENQMAVKILSGMDNIMFLRNLKDWISNANVSKNFLFEYLVDVEYLMNMIHAVELHTQDGKVYALSPDLGQIASGNGQALPIYRVIDLAMKMLVLGQAPLIFHVDDTTDISQIIDVLNLCEETGALKEIRLVNENGQLIANYVTFPQRSRAFILIVHPKSKLFEKIEVQSSVGKLKYIYEENFDQPIAYEEGFLGKDFLPGANYNLRFFLLSSLESQFRAAIFTNDHLSDPKKIIEQCVWHQNQLPSATSSGAPTSAAKDLFSKSKHITHLNRMIEDLISLAEVYMMHRFFDKKAEDVSFETLQEIFKTAGFCEVNDTSINVILRSDSAQHRELLSEAKSKFNHSTFLLGQKRLILGQIQG